MFPRRWLEVKRIVKECALYLLNSAKALACKWAEVIVEENTGPVVQEKIKAHVEKIQGLVTHYLKEMVMHKINVIAAYSCALSDECGMAPNPFPCEIHARAAVKIYEYHAGAMDLAVA